MAPLPPWRSALFVPVNVERFVAGAHRHGADAAILDLEDSVPPAGKAAARGLIADAAARIGRHGLDVLVRINRPWRLAVRDIEAAVGPAVAAIAAPKVADAGHVRALAEVLDEVERERGLPPGHTRIVAMVETADAVFEVRDIARAHPRLVAMTLGGEDLALSAGLEPVAEALLAPNQAVVMAARAAGILPLGFAGSIAEYRDQEAFRATIRQARRLGLAGAFCIHPLQVQVCNAEFAPGAQEIDTAREMIAAYDKAQAGGLGAVVFEGKMIDEPVVARARATLALARRLAARE